MGVSVKDVFGDSTVDITTPKRLCAPADKNDEDPTAPTRPDHLAGYNIKQVSPKFQTVRGQVVSNQFGTVVLDVRKPQRLLVPTAKSETAPPAPLTPVIDHFKCYTVSGLRQRIGNITEDDQFGSTIIDLKKPVSLCVAADKNGEGTIDPLAALLCYKPHLDARTAGAVPNQVFVNNQFGPDIFILRRMDEFCVPSRLIP